MKTRTVSLRLTQEAYDALRMLAIKNGVDSPAEVLKNLVEKLAKQNPAYQRCSYETDVCTRGNPTARCQNS